MAKKRIVRNMAGNIIELFDETDGGWIIRKGQVVNQEKYQEMLKKEQDKKEAAKAILNQKVESDAPDRTAAPSRIDELEKKVVKQDEKLDAILELLKKK